MNADYAQKFFSFFHCPLFGGQLFKIQDGIQKQARTVWLRDRSINDQLLSFAQQADGLSLELGCKSIFNGMQMELELKRLHEVIKVKLKNQKYNGMQAILSSYLYELMPDTEEQRRLLPSINISLDLSTSFRLHYITRPKTRPRRVNSSSNCSFNKIALQVRRFREITLKNSNTFKLSTCRIIRALSLG